MKKLFVMLWALMPAMAGAEITGVTLQLLSGDGLAQSKVTTLADAGGDRAIVILWRSDCAPCRVEMKALPGIARAHADVNFVIVAVQEDAAHARRGLAGAALPNNVHVLVAKEEGEAVLAAFHDERRILPYSVSLRDGNVCKQQYGLLGPEVVADWAASC